MQKMKPLLALTFAFSMMMNSSYANDNLIVANNPNTAQNQLLAPSVFVFPLYIETIGQGITQILKATQFKLSSHIPYNIKLKLNGKLPMRLRKIGPMSVYEAIKTLTGAQIFVITPATHTLSFSYDSALSANDLKVHTVDSSLQKYLNRTNFTLRVARTLPSKDLNNRSSSDQVIAYNKLHKLYFGFNDQAQIVAVANSQKEANALAETPRAVFYALPNQTLRQTIERWASYDDTKVYYQYNKNMMLDQPAVFFGALRSPTGALSQLLKSVSSAGVNAKAVFSNNGALVIKANHYSSMFLNGDIS